MLEITLTGDVVQAPGESDNGMLMDFSEIKPDRQAAHRRRLGPRLLVYEGDAAVRGFLDTLPGHKTVVLDRIPTAENPPPSCSRRWRRTITATMAPSCA